MGAELGDRTATGNHPPPPPGRANPSSPRTTARSSRLFPQPHVGGSQPGESGPRPVERRPVEGVREKGPAIVRNMETGPGLRDRHHPLQHPTVPANRVSWMPVASPGHERRTRIANGACEFKRWVAPCHGWPEKRNPRRTPARPLQDPIERTVERKGMGGPRRAARATRREAWGRCGLDGKNLGMDFRTAPAGSRPYAH